ncbi:ECF-type sigma factor [Rhodobacter sp. CZR27]|uniref:ECF-type sigma factor n=1 Tax=Rhodobacter sp. CZR27 TaxID=2033869 RepID=UPI000BBEA756|nr:ECF-type sigma factor [Rhodobacter sp. CZR27]
MADLRALFLATRRDGMKLADDLAERRARACEILRSGEPIDQEIRNAIADLLDGNRGKGQPSRPPSKWWEVGKAKEEGMSVAEIADVLGLTTRTVERGLAYYRQAAEAAK